MLTTKRNLHWKGNTTPDKMRSDSQACQTELKKCY